MKISSCEYQIDNMYFFIVVPVINLASWMIDECPICSISSFFYFSSNGGSRFQGFYCLNDVVANDRANDAPAGSLTASVGLPSVCWLYCFFAIVLTFHCSLFGSRKIGSTTFHFSLFTIHSG